MHLLPCPRRATTVHLTPSARSALPLCADHRTTPTGGLLLWLTCLHLRTPPKCGPLHSPCDSRLRPARSPVLCGPGRELTLVAVAAGGALSPLLRQPAQGHATPPRGPLSARCWHSRGCCSGAGEEGGGGPRSRCCLRPQDRTHTETLPLGVIHRGSCGSGGLVRRSIPSFSAFLMPRKVPRFPITVARPNGHLAGLLEDRSPRLRGVRGSAVVSSWEALKP